MTRLRWDRLSKSPRDPGFAEERPDRLDPFVRPNESPPPSRLSSRKKATSQPPDSHRWVELFRYVNQKSNKHRSGGATGATTPFDRFSLGPGLPSKSQTQKSPAQSRKRKQKVRRKAKPSGQSVVPVKNTKIKLDEQTSGNLEANRVRRPNNIAVASLPQVEVGVVRQDAVDLGWIATAGVARWAVTCLDTSGGEIRKMAVEGKVTSITVDGLPLEQGPIGVYVQGSDRFGTAVVAGFAEAVWVPTLLACAGVEEEFERSSYHVYVVELEPALCEERGCPSANGSPPVYVGQTTHPPEFRFEQHKEGKKSSKHVRKHGVRLLPDLYADNGPYATRSEAEEAEAALASLLRQEGYCVFGGH
jgi:predicted GIY-YIG superfamily endonuclease